MENSTEGASTSTKSTSTGNEQASTKSASGSTKDAPISHELDALTCDVIGMALDKLADGEGIWPTLALLHNDNTCDYYVFEDDGLDVCLQEARGSVRSLGKNSKCYALFYDGFFEEENTLTDKALIVEFGERGMKTAFSAIVPYGNSKMGKNFWYDAPMPGGEEELLF